MTVEPPHAPRSAGEPLVERDRELALLRSLLAEAVGGEARVALIEGQAGIGKSRLLAELRAEAAAPTPPARICSARASELERELPFGVVQQLFEPLLAQPGAERWLAGAAASARPVISAIAEPVPGEAPQDSSFAALHGLHWLVVNLAADGPLLLSIDDLHWCDRPSLRFLAYLLRRLDGLPVLVAATMRVNEPGTDAAILGELAHDPVAVSIRPGPLSATGVRALVCTRLREEADDRFCDACAEVTGGNPLLLRQLLVGLAADGVEPTAASAELVHDVGPRAVSRTVLLSLARLPADAAAVARAVAVLGESADVRALATLAGLDEAAVGAAATALVRADLLQPEPPLAFVHPLVREAIYHELPHAQREQRHARAATLLRDAGAPAEHVAQQLLAVDPRGEQWAVEQLHDAARSALRKGRPTAPRPTCDARWRSRPRRSCCRGRCSSWA
jgi:predicted ATPase